MSDDSRFRYRREDGAGQDGRRAPASPPAAPPARPVSGQAAPPSRLPPAPPPRPQERTPERAARAPVAAPPAPRGADPLAELARLMDEQDAFSAPPQSTPPQAPQRGTEPLPPRRDPSRIEALRAEAARLEALRTKQAAARQAAARPPEPNPQGYAQEREAREAQAREAHARQLRQQVIEERREAARQELLRQEQARQALARQMSVSRELAPPDSERLPVPRPDSVPVQRNAPVRRPPVDAYEAESGARPPAAPQRPEPPAFLMAGRPRAAAPGLSEQQALDPRQVAAAERAARVAARQDVSAERPAYGADERTQGQDPRMAAPQRRAPSLHNPPQRTLLTPPSTADRADENGNSVRLGYGSLAHQRAAQQEREAEAAARLHDPEFAPEPYREPPPSPRPAPQREEPRAKTDSANYAYSAERRDNSQYGYDEYDDRYDPEYADDGYMPPHGDEIYDGEQRRKKGRRALFAVVAALALVVLGTAGVFAYRMVTGGTLIGSGSTPPVIRADTNPSKIITPPSAPDPQQKMIYDRVGAGGGANEQVLPREEAPVDVSTVATPRATPPEGITPESTEPKRVRTLTVRADGSVVADGSSALSSPNVENSVSESSADENEPMVSAGDGYVVQVASQRSEADAQGSWRALQTRYPNLLNSYTASVKQVNLGERGIYYRAQVGPFASQEEANRLCQDLRAQGGDCVVNRE